MKVNATDTMVLNRMVELAVLSMDSVMESPAVEAKTVSGITTSNDDDSDNSSKGASSLTVHEEEGEQSGEEEVSIVLRLHLIANIQDEIFSNEN